MLKFLLSDKAYIILLLNLISCRQILIYNTGDWAVPASPKADYIKYDNVFNKEIIFRITVLEGDESPHFKAFLLMQGNIVAILSSHSNHLKYYKISEDKYKEIYKLIENSIGSFRKYPYTEESCGGNFSIYIRYKNEYYDICEDIYKKDIEIMSFFCNLQALLKKEILSNYFSKCK